VYLHSPRQQSGRSRSLRKLEPGALRTKSATPARIGEKAPVRATRDAAIVRVRGQCFAGSAGFRLPRHTRSCRSPTRADVGSGTRVTSQFEDREHPDHRSRHTCIHGCAGITTAASRPLVCADSRSLRPSIPDLSDSCCGTIAGVRSGSSRAVVGQAESFQTSSERRADPSVAHCCITPEAIISVRLPLHVERGSLIEAAAWATNQKRGLSRTRRLRSFPSRSSLKVDPDFRFERGVFAGLEPRKHRGACKAPADPANRVTIARFGFVAVRGLRPAPARDDRQVRDQSERGTACRSERYSAPPRNPPTTRALRRRRTGDGQQIWQGLGPQREPVDCASREIGGGRGGALSDDVPGRASCA
jgi:hypothetical protein